MNPSPVRPDNFPPLLLAVWALPPRHTLVLAPESLIIFERDICANETCCTVLIKRGAATNVWAVTGIAHSNCSSSSWGDGLRQLSRNCDWPKRIDKSHYHLLWKISVPQRSRVSSYLRMGVPASPKVYIRTRWWLLMRSFHLESQRWNQVI